MFLPFIVFGVLVKTFVECVTSDKPVIAQPVRAVETNDTELSQLQFLIGTTLIGNFFQAIEYCNLQGMSLLSLQTREKEKFLYDSLDKFTEEDDYAFWTSGSILSGDHWMWFTTGKPFTILWPDNNRPFDKDKPCLGAYYVKDINKRIRLKDFNCFNKKHVICEASMLERSERSCNCGLSLVLN